MGRIDIICNDGSPLQVTEQSVYGYDGRVGVGGAELALLTMCKGWHDAGHRVRLYNSPDVPNGSCFEQRGIDEFQPYDPRDVLIVFRSPNMRIRDGANGLKVWWSCDQMTVGNFKDFATKVDKIVTISPHHAQYFKDVYGIFNTITVDLPVRMWEYDLSVEKVPYQCIFNSIPDRGALELAQVWRRVVEKVPNAQLAITSDWRLWTKLATWEHTAMYRAAFANLPNVTYRGAICRKDLVQLELESQVHINPNIYEELFCIAIAETQIAGAYPVSSTTGALRTTNMGKAIEGNPQSAEWQEECSNYVVELLQDPKRLKRKQNKVQHEALHRFSLEKVLKQWEERVFA
jgi:glycosyltransferase involved in cell wall biosynthesis